jgi:hypothetical protein
MFRSVLGRLCTYGLVLGINGLPFAGLAFSTLALDPSALVQAAPPDDLSEGEEEGVVKWTPIPAFPSDAAAPLEEPDLLTTTAPDAVDGRQAPTVTKGGSKGAKGNAVAVAGAGPTAGDGTGSGADPGDGKDAKTGRPRRGARVTGKSKVCAAPHPNIHESPDGIVEIDRTLVDEYTKNLESFMKLGYSRPFDEAGLEGWYISGFGCSSPVAKAGFKKGDVLLAVNGKKTRSWVGVFMLYQRLKNKADFEVDLVRKGEPLTLKFRVVG